LIARDFPQLNAEEVEKYARLEQKEKAYKDPDTIARTRRVQSEATNEAFGIFALSEIRDNILMWSHYSAAHKGLCIGFDCYMLNEFLSDYLGPGSIACFKVDYDLKYPSIFLNEAPASFFKKLFLVKASAWEYEKEWRFILFRRTNKEIQIPEEIISEVVLGCRMPREHRIEVIEILRDRKSEVKVYQAEPSTTKFQLDLREVDYLWRKQD
jgi:hypothetical protein